MIFCNKLDKIWTASLIKKEELVKRGVPKGSYPSYVYDLTVEDNHNYFICLDEVVNEASLSHNCLEFVIEELIGPIVVTSEAIALQPEIEIVETKIKFKSSKLWANSISNMLLCKEKNDLLLKHLFEDLKEHSCIIIPTDRTSHVDFLVKEINSLNERYGSFNEGSSIAYSFYGAMKSKDKQDALAKVETGECRVLVSMRQMIKQGIDMKKPTMLYHIIPETANEGVGSPLTYQLLSRVATPYPNKPQPRIKMFVDNTGLSIACFKSLFGKEIKPNLNKRYKMLQPSLEIAYDLMKRKF